MNLLQLKYFITVSETLNFTEAAKINMVAQTAVSYQIKALEEELNVRLFMRSTRAVSLTEAGKAFYEDAKALLRMYEESVARAQAIYHGKQLTLRVGFSSLAASDFFPALISRFQKEYPEIQLELVCQDMSLALLSKLKEGMLDVACCFDIVRETDGIVFAPLGSVQSYVILPPDHPLACRDEIKASDIEGQTLIMFDERTMGSSSSTKRRTEDFFKPKKIIAAPDAASIELMITAHSGIALLPLVGENKFNNCKCVKYVEDGRSANYMSQLVMSWDERNTNPAIRDFVRIARQVVQGEGL